MSEAYTIILGTITKPTSKPSVSYPATDAGRGISRDTYVARAGRMLHLTRATPTSPRETPAALPSQYENKQYAKTRDNCARTQKPHKPQSGQQRNAC